MSPQKHSAANCGERGYSRIGGGNRMRDGARIHGHMFFYGRIARQQSRAGLAELAILAIGRERVADLQESVRSRSNYMQR